MAFRRQDIPKTTRKSEDGSTRTLFPRYLRDRALLPSIGLAVDYLESMVGRRRQECSPDTLLELFGDAKLARCLLACMSERYRYRTLEFADVLGEEAAAALLDWGIATPADLRAYLYLSANQTRYGFAAGEDRVALLSETAEVLGIDPEEIDRLIHLDAERNAILVRTGPIPDPETIVARYNAMLTLSVLRHASRVEFDALDLDDPTVFAVCERHGITPRWTGEGQLVLHGRRSAMGSWSPFGARLARCVVHLAMASNKEPSGIATVYLGQQRLEFRLDRKSLSPLRPKARAAAGEAGIVQSAELADKLVQFRRDSDEFEGWTIRRWPEPVVTGEAVLLPELLFTRGGVAIAALPVPGNRAGVEALTAVGASGQVVGLTDGTADAPFPWAAFEPASVAETLSGLAARVPGADSPLAVVEAELVGREWLPEARLLELLHHPEDLAGAVRPLLTLGDLAHVAGFGLCRLGLLAELGSLLAAGPIDIAAFRRAVQERVRDAAGLDSLVLHLLSQGNAIATAGSRQAA